VVATYGHITTETVNKLQEGDFKKADANAQKVLLFCMTKLMQLANKVGETSRSGSANLFAIRLGGPWRGFRVH
jgi:hypothetical protein